MTKKIMLILAFSFILISLLGALFWVVDVFLTENLEYKDQVEKHLVSIVENKVQRINSLFDKYEKDVDFLSKSFRVKQVFQEEIIHSKNASQLDVKEKTRIISREIDNYIKANFEMTLEDLKNNEEFKSIAIRKIGIAGYTVLMDLDTLISVLHINPDFIGVDYNSFEEISPEAVEILRTSQRTRKDHEGFYDWLDPDGVMRDKYAYLSVIPTKTSDGRQLLLITTTYLEDYKVANLSDDAESYLKSFKEEKDYFNLLLISEEGHIIHMVDEREGLGTNINENQDVTFFEYYNDFKENNKISFYGPFIGRYGERYLKILTMAPIYDDFNDLLGTVALISSMEKINDISTEATGLGETGDSYIVDDKGRLITPTIRGNLDLIIQTVDTENSEECLEDLEEAEELGVSAEELELLEKEEGDLRDFYDYKGDLVHGTDFPISQAGWCLLSEIQDKEIIDAPREEKFIPELLMVIFLTILTIILSSTFIFYFNNKYEPKLKSSSELKNNLKGGFFGRLKLRYVLLISLIFVLSYFFIVNSFFQGGEQTAFYDPSDLIIVFSLIILLHYAFKLNKYAARAFIVPGIIILIVGRLFEIVLEKYIFTVGFVSSFYWIPISVLGYIGLILLLFGFREVIE